MFIFDQVWLSTDSARGIIEIYVRPLVYFRAVEQEGSTVVVRFPVLKRKCAKNTVSRNFHSKYDCLVFIVVFGANNPCINIMYNIQR